MRAGPSRGSTAARMQQRPRHTHAALPPSERARKVSFAICTKRSSARAPTAPTGGADDRAKREKVARGQETFSRSERRGVCIRDTNCMNSWHEQPQTHSVAMRTKRCSGRMGAKRLYRALVAAAGAGPRGGESSARGRSPAGAGKPNPSPAQPGEAPDPVHHSRSPAPHLLVPGARSRMTGPGRDTRAEPTEPGFCS